MTAIVVAGAALLVLMAVATGAYHRGQRQGRVRMPASLVAELRHHKVHCVGEPAARVALEIGLLCETDGPGERPAPL